MSKELNFNYKITDLLGFYNYPSSKFYKEYEEYKIKYDGKSTSYLIKKFYKDIITPFLIVEIKQAITNINKDIEITDIKTAIRFNSNNKDITLNLITKTDNIYINIHELLQYYEVKIMDHFIKHYRIVI